MDNRIYFFTILILIFVFGCNEQSQWEDRYDSVSKNILYSKEIPQVGMPLITETVAGYDYSKNTITINPSYPFQNDALLHETGHQITIWQIPKYETERWNRFVSEWAKYYYLDYEDLAEVYRKIKQRKPSKEMLLYRLITEDF